MKELKVGDEIFINKTGDKGVIESLFSIEAVDNKITTKDKIGDVSDINTIMLGVKLDDSGMIKLFNRNEITKIEDKKPKETIPFKIIGAEIEDCKILWNRIDHLNLEFSVEGRANIVTVLKVLIKHLDLREFTYERVCPYKIMHEYARNNEEKNHIFSIKYVDFNGEIKTQEIIRADKSLAIENCKFNIFIPDLLEVAKSRNIVRLEGNVYIMKENKLNGVCNNYQPIREVNRSAFEEHGWTVPKFFEKKFMKYKKF
ncbi:hypothetical protein [Clostridium perfringens]|uniref:hypothetical protein n=1 Tax=Clostridium perfringens TaxID=1502 RepID=UPI00096A6122|nr:hypothetical protein [Clostridium perfringens]